MSQTGKEEQSANKNVTITTPRAGPSVAFIDSRAVPTRTSVGQLQVMFPAGIAGLVDCATGDYVFPSEDGSLKLEAKHHYSLGAAPSQSTPSTPMLGMSTASAMQASLGSAGKNSRFAPTQNEVRLSEHPGSCTPLPKEPLQASLLEESENSDEALRLRGKLILDRVHDHIALPPIVFDVIDTMEFQRLRQLKQLGTCVYLYPGATHTRFEHSIGVAHLAGLMIKKIARRQPELGVTEADILCIQVAGLCHDLGHGPFSHLFEDIVNAIRVDEGGAKWHHEDMSIVLVRRILARINLEQHGLGEEDVNLIELMISGLRPGDRWPTNVGRPASKRFLVDIVANKRNGIDVDKLDYFLRDSLCCYGRPTVDCHVPRLLASCRVINHEGESQICYEEKMALSLGDIFTLRAKLHKYAYQHRIVKVVDTMVSDILRAADAHFFVKGADGKAVRISQCMEDIEGFCSLGDWILNAMGASSEPKMAEAQKIINRLNERDLYSVAGYAQFARFEHRISADSIKDDILRFADVDAESLPAFRAAVVVTFVKITYGSSDSSGRADDPINHVSFYNPKSRLNRAHRLPQDRMSPLFSPSEFGEKSVLVMVRDDAFLKATVDAMEKWKQSYQRHLNVAVPVHNFSPSRPVMRKRAHSASKAAQPTPRNLAATRLHGAQGAHADRHEGETEAEDAAGHDQETADPCPIAAIAEEQENALF